MDKLRFSVASIIDDLLRDEREAEAWRETAKRLSGAHEYVKKYCMLVGWGRNVWHTVLDDAIRLRKENEELKFRLEGLEK